MAFNQDALLLLPLGIQGDQPVDPQQTPALPDGIHLRWAPDPAVGFPWYGFYLFRRETQPSRPRCLAAELGRFHPGTSQSLDLVTALGRLSSAKPLVLTDDFPPAGQVEVDLGQGAGLRFDLPAGIEARRVDLQIGLRDVGPQTTRACVDFRTSPLGVSPSPRTETGAVFTTTAPPVSPAVAVISIEQWPGSPPGLQTTPRLTIALPCPALRVDLLLTNRGELTIEGLSAAGGSTGVQTVKALSLTAGTVTLTGPAITQVIVTSPTVDPALLHQICWDCPTGGTGTPKGPAIEVRALAGTAVVANAVVQGDAGTVVAATLQGEGITAVEIATGKAALVDLCLWPTQQGVTFGWDEVPRFQYPLCLPVATLAAPGYPCPGAPATPEDAYALARSRVTYPAPPLWDSDLPHLHDELVTLVHGGPGAGPMASREHDRLSGTSLSPANASPPPTLPYLRPLELLSLASLQPAIAQMLGLYFADTSVALGVAYDYLLLADPTGVLGGSAATALAWLAFTPDPTKIDGVLVLNRSTQTHPTIPSTGDLHAYALPGATTRALNDDLRTGTGNVGLWWALPPDPPPPPPTPAEHPEQAIFYYPRRCFFGLREPLARPPGSAYQPLQPTDTPLLVSVPEASAEIGPRSADWPPSQDVSATATTPAQTAIPLHLVDPNLAEGWYSYRIVVQDLFGRRSDLGPEARWLAWDPPPEHEVHPYAVNLLDTVAPSTPLGVEAWALDPKDPWVLMDDAYTKWRSQSPAGLVGLRVRWRWTLLQQLQAPDTREFRIYYQPGRWNALLGKVVAVAAGTGGGAATESWVDLDFADSQAADAFAGARLRVGNDDFAILGSQPGAHLRLRVKNLGVQGEVVPTVGKPCTVAIPEHHKLWVDTGLALTWSRRLAYAPYDPPVRIVIDPSKDTHGQVLTDVAFQAANLATAVTLQGTVAQLPPAAALAGVQPLIDHLWIADASAASETRRILSYDVNAGTVTVETAFTVGPPVHWTLGRPAREYEVFLPAPDVGPGNPFEPSPAEPAVYAQIAVSAADDKAHALDDPKWASGTAHFGNESRLSPSATVFRVLQMPPLPPELVEKDGRIFATPADYHSRSYYTFRFVPQENLKVHLLRALDESLFRRDWLIRETRTALDPVPDPPPPGTPLPPNVKWEHRDYFPDDMKFADRAAAAAQINAIHAEAGYAGLSTNAWDVLALLPGNEGFAGKGKIYPNPALQARDWLLRQTRTALTVTDDVFPASWNNATRTNAVGPLNAIAGPTSYAGLQDDELRVLAALPANDVVFLQVTHEPFAMEAPAIQDERRPDDSPTYSPDPVHRRAVTDTLDGNASSRYFYRARFVDGAQNQSGLSGPTPPVYLPKVTPPRAPVITGVVGGERQITIQWAANREGDLKEYRVYRTESREASRDERLMALAAVVPTTGSLSPIIEWSDLGLRAKVVFYHRIAVVDKYGDVSSASAVVSGRAVDHSVPAPPSWLRAEWVQVDKNGTEYPITTNPSSPDWRKAVSLGWATEAYARALIEKRILGRSTWTAVSDWLLSEEENGVWTMHWQDVTANPAVVNVYRLRVESEAGNLGTSFVERSVDPV